MEVEHLREKIFRLAAELNTAEELLAFIMKYTPTHSLRGLISEYFEGEHKND